MPANRTTGADEEFQIPPITVSPLTGMQGSTNWGGLNKFNIASRQVISDVEADELINWIPQLSAFQQVPGPSGVIGSLPAGITVIWAYTDILKGNLYTYILASDGHIRQMDTSGVMTDLGSGFGPACDMANWQATQILFTDPSQAKIFSWDGTTLTTLFSSQPAEHIAVYANRVWLSHNLTLTWTNANTNNSFGGDSGTFIITEGRCANPIIAMRDYNASLYVFGSNWIKTIYNLQPVTVNDVTTLSFQQPTLESQVGPINKWSIAEYGGMLFFANMFGFWMINGSFPTKISSVLDGFFQSLDLANTSWSCSWGFVYGMPCVFWNVRWNGDGNWTVFGYTVNQQWFRVIPQTGSGAGVVKWICGSISSAVLNNRSITYYSDGNKFYDLFGGTGNVTSVFNSKIWDFYSKISVDWFTNAAIQFVLTEPATLTVCEVNASGVVCGPAPLPAGCQTTTYNINFGDWINNSSVIGQWINAGGVTGHWQGVSLFTFVLAQYVVPFQERGMGLNITLTSSNAVLQAIVISFRKMMQSKG
jgi:hypothetical protein